MHSLDAVTYHPGLDDVGLTNLTHAAGWLNPKGSDLNVLQALPSSTKRKSAIVLKCQAVKEISTTTLCSSISPQPGQLLSPSLCP